MRHGLGATIAAFSVWLVFSVDLCAQTVEDGLAALRTGQYDHAITTLEKLVRGTSPTPGAGRVLIEALSEVGRYDDAVRRGRSLVGGSEGAEVQNALGEALYATGDLEGAKAAFEAAMEGGATDRHVAALNLAVLRFEYGERPGALSDLDAFIDLYNRGDRLSSRELTAVGTAVAYLSRGRSELAQDALMAFDRAAAAQPTDPEPKIRTGNLFLDRYDGAGAADSFREVLARNPSHPRALLGLARVLEFEGSGGAAASAARALEINPNLVAARVLLARLHLSTDQMAAARAELDEALAVNPRSIEALSVEAATFHLQGDTRAFARAVERFRALAPASPELHSTVAELSVTRRRYADAVRFAEVAVSIDPTSWKAYGLLGINQMRMGQVEAGRTNLEAAFEGDPFNPWFKNTLDLLDTFVRYQTVRTPHFEILLDTREAALLAPYFESVAEEAFAALANRYGYAPPTPVRIEVFPSHADFSVRTVGLAGLGALGVAFGPVIAMDSPSARPQGEFNWASTLWHEVAHVFHLGMTDNSVPRWFSEGLAVHEQRQARPGWGHPPSVGFLQSLKSGGLRKVSELDRGFMQPRHPGEVLHSYYQASLVFELIEKEYGFEKVLEMLDAYARGHSNSDAFRQALGITAEEFDDRFEDYLQDRFESTLASVAVDDPPLPAREGADALRRAIASGATDFRTRLALGKLLFDQGHAGDAEPHLEAADEMFPEYGGPDSPHWYLAQIREQDGDLDAAVSHLEALAARNENHYEGNRQAAEVHQTLGNVAGAVAAMERIVDIHPFNIPDHELLAELYERSGRPDDAVRERAAVLALEPVDRASALYRLARAHFEAGDHGAARRQVLRALELAPNYEEALELLLELREATRSPQQGGVGEPR